MLQRLHLNTTRIAVAVIASFFLSAATSTNTRADEISYSGFFSDFSASDSFFDSGGGGFFLEQTPIEGIEKFDSSLGTLTGISLHAEFDFEMFIEIYTDEQDVIDPNLSHSAEFEADFLQVFIGYSPTGSTSTFVLPEFTSDVFVHGDGDPFDSGYGDNFVSEIVDETSDVLSLSGVSLSDWVGTGAVDTIGAYIAMPAGGTMTLDNVEFAAVDLYADMYHSDLTVTYQFTAIPEPASGILLSSFVLIAGLTRRRRR